MRRLIFGCLLCGLLAACENSNYGSDHQDETPMFSLFKKKYPTTVHPALQAELKRIESFPATPVAAVPSGGTTCTKYALGGKPPQVVLSEVRDKLSPSIGFVISNRPDNAVLLMNSKNAGTFSTIELWQLASVQDVRLTRKIPMRISPDESSWTSRFVKETLCLPNGRVLVAIEYSSSLTRYDLFLYNIEEQQFSKFFDNYETRRSEIFDSQWLNSDAAIVLHFSDARRDGPELYYNYYNRFQLFTPAHPEGLEALKLGIDIGNVKQWRVIDNRLYLHTYDPRTEPIKPREAYWSLDLSKLLN